MPGFVHVPSLNSGAGGKLYLNERHSDVVIVVESGHLEMRYPAHSLVLSCMSDVINRMLDMDMVEKSTKKITITDSNPQTIKQFLRFIYTGEACTSDWREVMELLRVAHKYEVSPLISICEKRLIDALSLSRACCLHELSQLYSLAKLKNETLKLILHSAFIILATNGFETLSSKSIDTILSSRLLNVESEVSVLNALKHWGKAECSKRGLPITKRNVVEAMEPFLQHIRFSSIPRLHRLLISDGLLENRRETNELKRVKFFVPPMLHNYMASLKFVVELGAFIHKNSVCEPLLCVKFSSETSLFILGFRIVGMFKCNFTFGNGSPLLVLSKDDNKCNAVQFDLSSVPWKGGTTVGEYIWREIVAYFPHPARVEPFACYSLTVKYGNLLPTKWPKTRIETNSLTTEMGPMNIYTFGSCAGITELFILPAPSYVDSCNDLNS